jgi:DNA-binding NtrC family response regulator
MARFLAGVALLTKVRAEMPETQVILLTAHATVEYYGTRTRG